MRLVEKLPRILPLCCLLVLVASGCADTKAWLTDKIAMHLFAERLGAMPAYQNEAQDTRLVMVKMRDGVELATHVYLPEGQGPWPAILVRDPYGFSKYLTCEQYVHFGYACVIQDVRGRMGSKGKWYPLVNERADGLDTLDWLVAQPWQNGKIGLWGESYVGLAIWAMADKLPPQVKTFVSNVSHGDFYEMIYHNGAFIQGISGLWSATLFVPLEKLFAAEDHWRDTIAATFPANGVDPKVFGDAWPAYRDYLQHPEKSDAYWHSAEYDAIRDSYKGVTVPVMLTDRWFDWFLPGALKNFEALPSRSSSLFIIEPGEHGGALADQKVANPNTHRFSDSLAWFDHFLKGKPLPDALKPGYIVYDNGADRWRHHDRWPLDTQMLTYHLADVPASHACEGGRLSENVPATPASASFVYDPRHPVPTRGGAYLVMGNVASHAAAEQKNDLCSRPDVLSFGSPAFAQASLISGVIRIKLQVASDAADTAFTVKLSEHFADGRVLNIRDDISTISLRNGAPSRIAYTPGSKVELVFELPSVSWQIQPGSRLRLDISSSNAPVFFPHPNTAGLWSEVSDPKPARQTVYGGSIVLPVTP